MPPQTSQHPTATPARPPIFLYTDGASSGNPGPGGWGVVLVCGSLRKEMSGGFRRTTNNRMELLAVIMGLEAIKWEGATVEVYSDSSYVVDAVSKGWLWGWVKKDFAGKKNRDLWTRFIDIYRKHKVTFHWLKGHNGHPENERCDQMAVYSGQGAIERGETLPADEYFEKYYDTDSVPVGTVLQSAPSPSSAQGETNGSSAPRRAILYTDGAASGNPGPGGWGAVLVMGSKRTEMSGGFRLTTNNRMELLAVIKGLEAIPAQIFPVVEVYSDSSYVVNAVEKGWLWNWVRSSFDKKKNADLWMRFVPLYKERSVRFHWLKGHSGHPENERCDALAVDAGAGATSRGEILPSDVPFEQSLHSEATAEEGLFGENTD